MDLLKLSRIIIFIYVFEYSFFTVLRWMQTEVPM